MRVIASILFMATLLQMPMMMISASATEETPAAVFETTEKNQAAKESTVSMPKTYEAKVTVEEETITQAEEKTEEIIYKKIVKAEPIDTSKPILQDASGTLSMKTGNPYDLTDYERELIERVAMAEIRGGSYNDKLAVVQCIYDRIVYNRKTVEQVIFQKNAFADPYYKTAPSKSIKNAVSEVFDEGKRVTEEPIFYFIATSAVTADCFHETQKCVYVTDAHRYYTTWKY